MSNRKLQSRIVIAIMAMALALLPRVAKAKTVKTTYEKKTSINFEDTTIEGDVKKPHGSYLLHGSELDFQNLHRMKQDLKRKIIESTDYLEVEK